MRKNHVWLLLPFLYLLLSLVACKPGELKLPFKATYDAKTTQVKVGPAGKCFGTNSSSVNPIVEGTGQALYLGASTALFDHCLVPGVPPGGSTPLFNGHGVLTAANGDELHLTYQGTFSILASNGYPHVEIDYLITGGTGRFSQASGGGDGTFTFSNRVIPPGGGFPIYDITIELEGLIGN